MQQNKQDADVEKSEDIDEDTNDMKKLMFSKNIPRSCLNMMQAGKQSPMALQR